jgi:hypothetical protein
MAAAANVGAASAEALKAVFGPKLRSRLRSRSSLKTLRITRMSGRVARAVSAISMFSRSSFTPVNTARARAIPAWRSVSGSRASPSTTGVLRPSARSTNSLPQSRSTTTAS